MPRRRALVVAALVPALALASCSGDAPEAEPCTEPVPADRVRLEDFVFDPACLAAAPGAAITLENVGDAPHTFTLNGTDVNVDVPAGETGEATLTGIEPGRYAVTCVYHPQMTATLTVEAQ